MGLSSWRRAAAPASLLAASVVLFALISPPAGSPAAAAEPGAAVMTVTGDIDGCDKGEDTADLVAKIPGPIATVGDNAYPEGTADALDRCYDPTWGPFKDRTHPVPGNHDYEASNAAPYYEYFGVAAGERGRGWYSYDVGAWHVVALNSNCDNVDCGDESSWLQNDLRAHPSACILAYWHHPRFSSGTSGGDGAVGAFWKVLYEHGASLVLNGHDHDYERFAPQDPSGHRDPARGIREFIVGTGGAGLGSMAGAAPNSEVRNNRAYGVLELTLRPDGYDWRFVAVAGDSFTDSGSDTCRGTAPTPAPPPAEAAPPPAEPAPPPGEPETPEPTTEPAPGSSDSGTPAPPPHDPLPGRRPPRTAPSPAPPRAPRGATSAAHPGGAAKPAPPPASDWEAQITTDSVAPSATPDAAGAPTPAGDAAPSATVPVLSTSPGPPGGLPADGDTASMALAISGLIETRPMSHDTGRWPAALVAITLMAADCAALGAIRRRRVFSG